MSWIFSHCSSDRRILRNKSDGVCRLRLGAVSTAIEVAESAPGSLPVPPAFFRPCGIPTPPPVRDRFPFQVKLVVTAPHDGRRELMAITGLTAQELVNLARSAFGAARGAVSAANSAATAVRPHVFCSDGITGDGFGVDLVGMYPHTPPS